MWKRWVILRFLLVAGALTFCFSACGGSGPSPSSSASSAAKTASWTNVSVRAFDKTVNINWDKAASSTATGSSLSATVSTYNIYCSTTPADIVQDKNRIATNYAGTSFDHTGITNGQRYYYAVTEMTAAGEGVASRVVSATPQAVQPAAPYGLKVTALAGSVKVDFVGPTPPKPAEVSYNLHRSTTRDFTANTTIIPFTASYTDQNVTNGTTYYYAITAVVAGTESGLSPVVSARPQAEVAAVDYVNSTPVVHASFGSPTDMSAEPGNGSCIIRWTNAALPTTFDPQLIHAPDYILYWSVSPDISPDNNDGHIDNVAKDASGGFKNTNLTNGKTYYFIMVAATKDSSGNVFPGPPGPVVSATLAAATPAVPSGVSVTQQGTEKVLLTWNKDSSGVSPVTYNIYFSETDATTPAELKAKGRILNGNGYSASSFTHSSLKSGTTCYYVITSVGPVGEGAGESAPSSIVSVTL